MKANKENYKLIYKITLVFKDRPTLSSPFYLKGYISYLTLISLTYYRMYAILTYFFSL